MYVLYQIFMIHILYIHVLHLTWSRLQVIKADVMFLSRRTPLLCGMESMVQHRHDTCPASARAGAMLST